MCTAFFLVNDKSHIVGRTFDWPDGTGNVNINKKGNKRKAKLINLSDNPLVWTSRFGSLTFNGIGDAVLDGINEKKLHVATLWLDESIFQSHIGKPTVSSGQLSQYLLDNCASVSEVIAELGRIRVEGVIYKGMFVNLHFFISDKEGNNAIIDYIDGNLVINYGKPLAIPVLTNDTYANSIAFLKKHRGFGGKLPLPKGYGILERFVRTSSMIKDKKISVDRAFEIIKNISQPKTSKWPTYWNIVYDLDKGKLEYSTLASPKHKTINFSSIDFSSTKNLLLDINDDVSGDVKKYFTPAKIQ